MMMMSCEGDDILVAFSVAAANDDDGLSDVNRPAKIERLSSSCSD